MNQQLLCDTAIGFLRRGNLAEAARLYLQVLAAEPDNFTARHLLGIIRFQEGRNAEALDLIGQAVTINPKAAEALSNYGNVLKEPGQQAERRWIAGIRTHGRREGETPALYRRSSTNVVESRSTWSITILVYCPRNK